MVGTRLAMVTTLKALRFRISLGWGAKFGSDDFELKGHLLSMVV